MIKKTLASALAFTVILLSPGLNCYAALGEMGDSAVPDHITEGIGLSGSELPGGVVPEQTELGGINSPETLSPSEEVPTSKAELSKSIHKDLPAKTVSTAHEQKSEVPEVLGETPEVLPTGIRSISRQVFAEMPSDLSHAAAMDGSEIVGHAGVLGGSRQAKSFSLSYTRDNIQGVRRRVFQETKPWNNKADDDSFSAQVEDKSQNSDAELPVLSPGVAEKTASTGAPVPVATAEAAPQTAGPQGFFKKVFAWFGRFYNVFPDKIRNREFWQFNLAQIVITMGSDFYTTALPAFVAPTRALSNRMGMTRATSQGSQLVADVVMGPTIDQKPTSSFLFKTYLGRGLFLVAIPVLFFVAFHGGLFPTLPLIGLLVGMSFLQNAGVLAANVGFNRLLGKDPAYYNKANAVNSGVVNLAGIISPALAGAFISWASASFGGANSGNVLAFGVYGLAAIVTGFVYRTMTLVNRDPTSGAAKKASLFADLAGLAVSVAAAVGEAVRWIVSVVKTQVDALRHTDIKAILAAARRLAVFDFKVCAYAIQTGNISRALRALAAFNLKPWMAFPAAALFIVGALAGIGLHGLGLHSVLYAVFLSLATYRLVATLRRAALTQPNGMLGEIKKGFLLFWHDKFLRLSVLFSAASLFVGDAIFFLALPSYITKIGAIVLPVFLTHLALIGHALAGYFSSPTAIFGLFLSASSLGTVIVNVIYAQSSKNDGQSAPAAKGGVLSVFKTIVAAIMRGVNRWLEKKFGSDLTPLQKQGVWSSLLNGAGWVVGLALFLTSHAWLALALMAASAFLQTPAVMIWDSLEQNVLNNTYPQDQAKISSAMSLLSQIFTVAGDLAFGAVMAKFALGLGLGLVMGVMGIAAVLAVIQPFAIFRPRPIKGGPKS